MNELQIFNNAEFGQKYMKDGEPIVTTKTLVYQKGVDAIRKRLQKGECTP